MRNAQALYWNRSIYRVLLSALVLLTASSIVQAQQADKVGEIMKLTGLDTSLDRIGDGISESFKQGLDKLSVGSYHREKVLGAVDPAAGEAFEPGKLRQELRAAFEARLDKAYYAKILDFQRTPLGMRMTALENAAHNPEGHKKMQAAAGELSALLKRQPERAKVLNALEKSLGLANNAADQAFYMNRAIAIGMLAADEKTASLSADALGDIDAVLEKLRPAIVAQMKQATWLSLAYTYRDASVAELRQYVRYLSSPAGKRLYEAGRAAMNEVLIRASGNFGHALMKELGKERA